MFEGLIVMLKIGVQLLYVLNIFANKNNIKVSFWTAQYYNLANVQGHLTSYFVSKVFTETLVCSNGLIIM